MIRFHWSSSRALWRHTHTKRNRTQVDIIDNTCVYLLFVSKWLLWKRFIYWLTSAKEPPFSEHKWTDRQTWMAGRVLRTKYGQIYEYQLGNLIFNSFMRRKRRRKNYAFLFPTSPAKVLHPEECCLICLTKTPVCIKKHSSLYAITQILLEFIIVYNSPLQ